MSEITIFLLYLAAAAAFAASRLPRFESHSGWLAIAAAAAAAVGVIAQGIALYAVVQTSAGFSLSLGSAVSIVGLELALIALIAAIEPTLRGIAAGLLLLAALTAVATGFDETPANYVALGWQVRSHILISLFSYGLLNVGAIVAIYALLQERRLRAGRVSSVSQLFAPLETTESLLFGIAGAGFAGLLLAILSGLTFVDNLFAQHLVHKTVISILALCVFGALLAGRHFAGWRGIRAISLYLGGFVLLCLAYFGTRFILEQVLNRSWG